MRILYCASFDSIGRGSLEATVHIAGPGDGSCGGEQDLPAVAVRALSLPYYQYSSDGESGGGCDYIDYRPRLC